MTWPDNQRVFQLDNSCMVENAVCFSVEQGTFGPHTPAINEEVVYFYNTASGPVILNNCKALICRIDDTDINWGQKHPLLFGVSLQLGHFTFLVELNNEAVDDDGLLHNLFGVHSEKEKADLIVPEVEDILPNGGHYTGDLRYFSEEGSESDVDILKKLEVEYKKFLIWGEQSRRFFDEKAENQNKFFNEDPYFELIRDEMKTKTMTECIVHAPSLFHEAWKEINTMDYSDELLVDDEKIDILKSLAPENISSKEKKLVPELVFHDLYKTGLDSLY